MHVDINKLVLMLIGLSVLLGACAGQIKPDIPDHLHSQKSDEARIILTREKQIAGAISPMIVIDIGTNIAPNAMLYIADLPMEQVIEQENIASIAGVPIDFMWFMPHRVNPLYCGDIGDGCIKYNSRWPRKKKNNILFGNATFITYRCKISDENHDPAKIMDMIFNKKLSGKNISNNDACKEIYHGGLPVDLSNSSIWGFDVPEFYGYFVLSKPLATGLSGFKDNPSKLAGSALEVRNIHRDVQVIGAAEVGDTLIWDREPGIMRLGSVWYDGVGFMPKNIHVEGGKTYYLHYTTRLGQRWELKKVE